MAFSSLARNPLVRRSLDEGPRVGHVPRRVLDVLVLQDAPVARDEAAVRAAGALLAAGEVAVQHAVRADDAGDAA